jgi:hypothetical protein
MDFLLKVAPIIISAATLIYTVWINKRTEKINKRTEKMLQASSLYDNVKTIKIEFSKALEKLHLVTKDGIAEKAQVYEAFLDLHLKYQEFFNEINDYCIKVNCGAINAEDYIKDTVSVNLSKFAEMQVTTYIILKNTEKEYAFDEILRPDYDAYKEYDKFLIKYNGGVNSAFWTSLKTKRRDCNLE